MAATVEKALQVIEALSAANGRPCGVTQLSRQLKLNKSTVYRLLETLRRHGYVRQDDDLNRYMLTTRLWELGVVVLRNRSVHAVAAPYLREAADESGESALLAIPDGDDALVIDKVDSSQPLRIVSPIGTRLPVYCTALGRSMLIDAGEKRLRQLATGMQRLTERTVATAEELIEAVHEARRRGYAFVVDEYLEGVAAVAAPIRDASGTIIAAVALAGPTLRLDPGRSEGLGAEVAKAAARIAQALGHSSQGQRTAAE